MEYFALFLLINSCVAQLKLLNISQPVPYQAVQLGHSVTLQCSTPSSDSWIVWYKLTAAKGLQCVIQRDFEQIYYCGRYDKRHVYVEIDKVRHHLTIKNTTPEDTGTYFCGVSLIGVGEFQFGPGTFLMIQGVELDNKNSVVQLPVSVSAQPGDSVTLNCTVTIVHTETCGGQHSVYWFRSSRETQTGLIHTHGSEPEACQKTPGQYSCVYKLTMSNVTVADAGHYVCSVALCGETFFGNGTRLDVGEMKEDDCCKQMNNLVLLSISRTGVVLLCLLIFTVLYMTRK